MSEEIKNLLEQIDPEDYIGNLGLDYRMTRGSSGTQINIKECPRCGGSSFKVYLSAETGLGNCFHGDCVGEAGFNLFTFTKHLLGSGKEAFKEIEQYVKLCGWVPTSEKRKASNTLQGDFTLPQSHKLPINGKNLKYLANRNIDVEVAEMLDWRYCDNGYFPYVFEDKNVKQYYSGRVLIPIYDVEGKMVTFQGRDITGTAEKKYLFPPGLAGSGKYLYNGHNVVGIEEVVMCEGAFDVAAVIMAFKSITELSRIGVIGTFGKHFSMSGEDGCQLSELLKLKEHGLRRIVLMWDGEESTLDEACKTGLSIKSHGFDVRIAILPKDKDPNEVSSETLVLSYYRSHPVNQFTIAKLRLMLIK